jgi:hypothetical protein
MMKRRIALILTFIAGSLGLFAFFFPQVPLFPISLFVPSATFEGASGRLDTWMVIVAGFALTLGVVNVIQTHGRRIMRQEKGWMYSVALLAGLFTMSAASVMGLFSDAGIGKYNDGSPTPFDWIFANIFFPLQATMFSLLAFFMASAAYRAFRIRSFQATLLLAAAVIVMLGRIPFGETISPHLPESLTGTPGGAYLLPWLTNWIMDKPNSAGQSGIIIGAALGAAALSLRVILGLETSYLGQGKEG